jgi:AcrR family transcriptional regulator
VGASTGFAPTFAPARCRCELMSPIAGPPAVMAHRIRKVRDYHPPMSPIVNVDAEPTKREEILDVALEEFAGHGYDRTSVRRIARLCGLSQAGVLHYFSSKEELFTEVLRRRDVVNRRLYDEHGDDPINVERLVSIVRHNGKQSGLVRLYVSMSAESTAVDSPARDFFVSRYRSLRAGIAEDCRVKQAHGVLDPDLDPDVLASLLIAAADGLQIQWLLDPESVDMGDLLDQLWRALRRIGVAGHGT